MDSLFQEEVVRCAEKLASKTESWKASDVCFSPQIVPIFHFVVVGGWNGSYMFLLHAMIFEKKLLCSASKIFHWFLYKNIQFIKLWYKALSCIWHSGRSLGQNESLIRVICAHGRGLKDGGTFRGEQLALWGCVAPRTWNSNKSDKCIIRCFFLVRGGVDCW